MFLLATQEGTTESLGASVSEAQGGCWWKWEALQWPACGGRRDKAPPVGMGWPREEGPPHQTHVLGEGT